MSALNRFLADVRDLTGAEFAGVWRAAASGNAHTLDAWSSASRRAPVLVARHAALVAWGAQQAVGEVASDGTPPTFVVSRIEAEESPPVVLCVGAARALGMTKEALRQWMPRFAAQVGVVRGLVRDCAAAERSDRQTAVLLEAAARRNEHRGVEALGAHVCQAALEMTTGRRAALVRWDASRGTGEVAFATRGHVVRAGDVVAGEGQIAAACRGNYPVLLEDATTNRGGFILYGGQEAARPLGSLAIVPMQGADGVVGAVVIEGDEPGAIAAGDAKYLRLLGILAAASLQTVWDIEEISYRARTDPLTGLANRQEFEQQLTRLVAETDRFGGTGALVVLDIDHFKQVNDTYGHHGGDVVLRAVAEAVRGMVRTVDIVARYGGEELAILLPQTDLVGACQLAERLRRRIAERTVRVDGREVSITVSMGVACYPTGARSRDELFGAADRALYTAKRGGRNRVIADVV